MQDLRNNKKVRLGVIIFLMLLVAVLYFRNINTSNLGTAEGVKSELGAEIKPDTWEKKALIGLFAILGAALGMEATNNDWDLKKLYDTKGDFSASKVLRDEKGNIVTAEEVKAGTKKGKYTDEYNCADFKTQDDAQGFFDKAGGVKGDTNRLDGDKNGIACQTLPRR